MLRFMHEMEIRMKFEWDEEKNRINKRKHKISFETAALYVLKVYILL